jgi:hypothetical protein
MKEIWVLSVKTSLPEECYSKAELKTTFSAFETFPEARKAMRDTVKGFAFSKNTMFDGDGRIPALDKYIGYMYEDGEDEECCEDFLTSGILLKIQNAFYSIFNGENVVLDIYENEYGDGMIGLNYNGDSVLCYGVDDGPCNGYDPYIASNAFSMEEEKDYYIYIDDLLGQDYSSELYIDLKKVEVK